MVNVIMNSIELFKDHGHLISSLWNMKIKFGHDSLK